MERSAKSSPTVVTLAKPAVEVPADLDAEAKAYFLAVYRESQDARGVVTPADRSLLVVAARAEMNERLARDRAAGAVLLDDEKTYHLMSKLAQSEGRGLRACLASLGLTGDRRGRRSTQLAKARQTEGGDGKWDDIWADLD